MSIEEAIALCSRITYKPGYAYVFEEAATDFNGKAVWFVLKLYQADRPDSTNGGASKVTLVFTSDICSSEELDQWQEVDFLLFARRTAALLEIHEMHEWLRFEGRLLHDPHDPKGKNRGELALGGLLYDPHANNAP